MRLKDGDEKKKKIRVSPLALRESAGHNLADRQTDRQTTY
jgi:hypothetical protein